jgi:hypothetical protein
MRPLPNRPELQKKVQDKLNKETEKICKSADQKIVAKKIYESARKGVREGKWFKDVIQLLGEMTGTGQPCMFCDSNEASEIDHYKPVSRFPLLAMTWTNFLWSCGICNREKGSIFPSDSEGRLINPIDDHAWDFFFIDEFGNLTPLWREPEQRHDQRAVSTCNILQLNRQTLQERRQSLLHHLKKQVNDTLELHKKGDISLDEIKQRIEDWRKEPFQPDVTDYFLCGPGCSSPPFVELFQLISKYN